MANLNLDFSNVQKQVLLDEGVYNVTLKKLEEKTSSTGKPMLLATYIEEQTGSALFENYVLTEEALWKLNELLTAAGVDTSAGMVGIDIEALQGLMFKAKVIQREYNGEMRNSIKKIFAA